MIIVHLGVSYHGAVFFGGLMESFSAWNLEMC